MISYKNDRYLLFKQSNLQPIHVNSNELYEVDQILATIVRTSKFHVNIMETNLNH